jgi:Proteolysis_6 C-terminal
LISANLMAEDKEIELMVSFLEIKIDLERLNITKAKFLNIEQSDKLDVVLARLTNHEPYLRKLAYKNLLEHLESVEMRTPQISFIKGLPENYADFYKKYFNTVCKLCKQPGITSICLLCGDCVCTMACGFEQEDVESSFVFLTNSWQRNETLTSNS